MENEFLNTGIGTIEKESLQPARVIVQGVRLDKKLKKDSEEVAGELIVLICKHPKREETIELSQSKFIINDNIRMISLWWNVDADKKLAKDSACALLLKHYNVETFNDLVGKEVETATQSDKNNYLCIKAY